MPRPTSSRKLSKSLGVVVLNEHLNAPKSPLIIRTQDNNPMAGARISAQVAKSLIEGDQQTYEGRVKVTCTVALSAVSVRT